MNSIRASTREPRNTSKTASSKKFVVCCMLECRPTQTRSGHTAIGEWLNTSAGNAISRVPSSRRSSTCVTMRSASCHGSATNPACIGSQVLETTLRFKRKRSCFFRPRQNKQKSLVSIERLLYSESSESKLKIKDDSLSGIKASATKYSRRLSQSRPPGKDHGDHLSGEWREAPWPY